MKKIFFKPILLWITVAISSVSVAAQDKPDGEVVKAPAAFEVRLPIVVLDKKKGFVSGLTQTDFAVLENNQPQEVTFFTDEKTSPPIFVGVLMDNSPSTRSKAGFSKQAAKNFIYSITRLRKDKGAFVTFDHEIKLRQDFTGNLGLLEKAIDGVKEPGQKTSLYDAIYQFCDQNLRSVGGRRVIVAITDGEDTFSRADLNDAIDMAQRTETVIFTVSTKGGFLGSVPGVEMGTPKDAGDKILDKLAAETGGQAFFTGDMKELENAFEKIGQELRSQYIITYRPANQEYDGKERKIEVRLTNEQKAKTFKIRTKTKYRAIKDGVK